MKTLHHILTDSEQAAAKGFPPVKNWPQVRASLHLIDNCIGLEKVSIATFSKDLPDDFSSLDASSQDAFPHSRSYAIARREISRLLSALGHVQDPWEALRVLLRNSDREDLERLLWPLISAGKAAGRAPNEVQASWVWSLDAERSSEIVIEPSSGPVEHHCPHNETFVTPPVQLIRPESSKSCAKNSRQMLRRAVVAFDSLYDVPAIAASGLLPLSPIGEPPRYDRCGRRLISLPASLALVGQALSARKAAHLQAVWQAICAAGGLGLSENPTPDELLETATWQRVQAISPEVIGLSSSSWTVYHRSVRAALRPYASRSNEPDEGALPATLRVLEVQKGDRQALTALWRRTLLCVPERAGSLVPEEYLELDLWRELWRPGLDALSAASLRQYESTSRKLLRGAAPDREDPIAIVRSSWTALLSSQKQELAPIRRAAEKAMLKPNEITCEWLSNEGLPHPACLADIQHASARVLEATKSDDIADTHDDTGWTAVRLSARHHGIDTSRLGPLEKRALIDGRQPSDVDADWAAQISRNLPSRTNARFRVALRVLDAMRDIPEVAHLLPAQSVGELPDRRHRGNRALPEGLARSLEIIGATVHHAENTRRSSRTLLRELLTRATNKKMASDDTSLRALLEIAPQLDLSRSKLLQARKLLEYLSLIE